MYDELHKSLFAIVSFFNHPKQDKFLIKAAGVSIDTALFPLLMRVAFYGSIGIVALSEQVDRDHSTVSRQVDKLLSLGLITRVSETVDKRTRMITLTDAGKTFVARIANARRTKMHDVLQDWDKKELEQLQSDLKHLVDSLENFKQ